MRAGVGRSASTIAASAALAIVGSGAADASIWLHYVFKPLTTILIFLLAWRVTAPVDERYRRTILSGLVFSLCGDVFLMLPKSVVPQGFLLGLASFLMAHLFFLGGLTRGVQLFSRPLVAVGLLLLALGNLIVLWPGLGAGLQVPVIAYMLCLVAMASQAVCRALELGTPAARLAGVGGLAFLASDTILAYNKFHAPVPYSGLLVLGTYYLALYCIARSVEKDA